MNTVLNSRMGHYLERLAILLLIIGLAVGTTGCTADGDVGEPTEIRDWNDLNAIRDNLEGSYVLMSHLDDDTDGYDGLVSDTVDGKGWQPIGTTDNPFKGTFDGNGNTISGLFVYRPDEDEVGLFGRVQEGLIKDIGLVSVNVTGKRSVGGLVGYSWKGTLDSDTRPPSSKTYSDGSVTGEENVGGLVGNNYRGIVNQCQSNIEVFHLSSTPDEERWRAGGLVGLNSGPVINCNYSGEVNGDRQVGGLVGQNAFAPDARIEDCGGEYGVYGNSEVGGVAGRNLGALRRASFNGTVKAFLLDDGLIALNEGAAGSTDSSDATLLGSYVGGVVGVNEGIVEDCSAQATVEGYRYVGGLTGTNNGTLEGCSAQATVKGYQYVGGLAGANGGNLESCSSSGDVTGSSDAGRLVGYNMVTGTVSNSDSASCVTGAINCGPIAGWNEGTIEEEEQAPTEVVLGATLPLTGIFAIWGQQGFGMQKAVDDQNDLGGIYLSEWDVTVPVRLIIEDNESDFAKVWPLSTDLVVTDDVHALLSPLGPEGLHDPTSVVANEYGVPQIIPGGPFETWYYGMREGEDWPYTWFSGFAIETKAAPPRDVQGYTVVDTWFTHMDRINAKANTNMIAGVFGSDDVHGIRWYNTLPGLMEDYGMTVVGVDEEVGLFPMDTTDFTSIIQAWQAADVETLWGNCLGFHFGMLLSQCYEEGFRPKICLVARAAVFPVDVISWGTEPPLGWGVGTEVWWSPHYEAAEGFVGIGDRTAASLAEDWATEEHQPLNRTIGPGYMAAQVMLDAIERAGDVDPDAINDALEATDLNTINGWVKFDPVTHFSPQPLSFGQWFYEEENEDEPFTLHIVASALDFIPAEADPIFPKPW